MCAGFAASGRTTRERLPPTTGCGRRREPTRGRLHHPQDTPRTGAGDTPLRGSATRGDDGPGSGPTGGSAGSVRPVRSVDEQLTLILSGAVRPAPVRVPIA